jgi:hypothetical protein
MKLFAIMLALFCIPICIFVNIFDYAGQAIRNAARQPKL